MEGAAAAGGGGGDAGRGEPEGMELATLPGAGSSSDEGGSSGSSSFGGFDGDVDAPGVSFPGDGGDAAGYWAEDSASSEWTGGSSDDGPDDPWATAAAFGEDVAFSQDADAQAPWGSAAPGEGAIPLPGAAAALAVGARAVQASAAGPGSAPPAVTGGEGWGAGPGAGPGGGDGLPRARRPPVAAVSGGAAGGAAAGADRGTKRSRKPRSASGGGGGGGGGGMRRGSGGGGGVRGGGGGGGGGGGEGGGGGYGAHSHSMDDLSTDHGLQMVRQILQDESEECCGPRPDRLQVPQDLGNIYVERSEGKTLPRKRSRPQKTDRWDQKMYLWTRPVGQRDKRGEVWVRCSYGYVNRRDLRGERIQGPTPLYHEYQLLFFQRGRPDLSSEDSESGSAAEGGGARKKKTKRKSPPQKAEKSKDADAHATYRIGTLYHVRMAEPEAGKGGPRRQPAAVATSKRYDMSLAPGEESWIKFHDQRGVHRGSIVDTDRGAKLESGSGDFAEWQERDPEEDPFEEGDVVAFGENGLTRRTDGAKMLGVISRRAVVSGSMPEEAVRAQWDQVAYCGIVPVKLRGRARKDDAIVPSGRHDGTAIAVSGFPTTYLGRTLEKKSQAVFEKSRAWNLVEMAVVSPVETVSKPEHQTRRGRAAACLARLAPFVLAVVLLLVLLKPKECAPISLPHGTLAGGCEGSWDSTCVYESCLPGYKLVPTTVPDYEHAPSAEARKSVEDYVACDPEVVKDPAGHGWNCHGLNSASDTDLGWCERRNATAWNASSAYCAVAPRPCSVCAEPGLGSGWQACELFEPSDGGAPMCSIQPEIRYICPDNWLYPSPSGDYLCERPERQYRRDWSATVQGCTIGKLPDGSPVPLSQYRSSEWSRPNDPVGYGAQDSVDFYRAQICSFPHSGEQRRRRLSEAERTRTCDRADDLTDVSWQSRAYSGSPMHCARRHCPAETVSILRNGLCDDCAGLDAAVTFPRAASVGLAVANMTLHPGKASRAVSIDCPAGFSGVLNRSCSDSGWSSTVGKCSRLRCPRLDIPLAGAPNMAYQGHGVAWHSDAEARATCYKTRNVVPSSEHLGANGNIKDVLEASGPCVDLLRHTLTFDEANTGPEKVVVSCPSPTYRGSMSATCDANTRTWVGLAGACTRQVCPAEFREVSWCGNRLCADDSDAATPRYTVRTWFPEQERTQLGANDAGRETDPLNRGYGFDAGYDQDDPTPAWATVPCCSKFSETGSCIGEGGFGSLMSRCDSQGRRVVFDSPAFRCWPFSTARGPRLDQPVDVAEQLWNAFRENAGDMMPTTHNLWELPATGILSSVSMTIDWPGERNEWRHVFSSATDDYVGDHDKDLTTIDTHSFRPTSEGQSHYYLGKGRAAAAFAQTTCRQLGYRRAAVVTNCRSLHAGTRCCFSKTPPQDPWWDELLSSRPDLERATSPLFSLLCPELRAGDSISKTCPSWLDVHGSSDTIKSEMRQWLQYHSRRDQNSSGFRLDTLARWEGPMPTDGSCDGSEESVARCFVSQMKHLRQVHAQDSAAQERKLRKRPCLSKLIVGCTNETSRPARTGDRRRLGPRLSASGTANYTADGQGVWVLGDGYYDEEAMFFEPKIFTRLGGPYDCRTGQRLGRGAIANATLQSTGPSGALEEWDLCWGQLLDPKPWEPEPPPPPSCVCGHPGCAWGGCRAEPPPPPPPP